MHRIKHHIKKHHKKYLFSIFGGRAIFKTVLLIVGLFGVVNVELNENKTYAANAEIVRNGGGIDNNRSTADNWSGGVLPDTTDIAIFNSTSTKNVTIDTNINIKGIYIQTGYTGTITQGVGVSINLGVGGYNQADGVFNGSDGDITISYATMTLSGGVFNSTTGLLVLFKENAAALIYNTGAIFNHNSGTVKIRGYSTRMYLNRSLELHNFDVDIHATQAFSFYIYYNDLIVNNLIITNGGLASNSKNIITKDSFIVKSTADGSDVSESGIKTSGNVVGFTEENASSPFIELNEGAVMTASNNTTINGLILNSGSVFNASSGTINIRGREHSKVLEYNTGALFNHNSGTISFKGVFENIWIKSPLELYNMDVSMNLASYYVRVYYNDLIVANNLTFTLGGLQGIKDIITEGSTVIKSTSLSSTVNIANPPKIKTSGNVSVYIEENASSPFIELNEGAVMTASNNTTINGLILNSGSVFNASSYLTKINGGLNTTVLKYNTGAVFNHNSGTISFGAIFGYVLLMSPLTLYNLDFYNKGPTYWVQINNNRLTTLNNLSLSYGTLPDGGADILVKKSVLVKSVFKGGLGMITLDSGANVEIEESGISAIFKPNSLNETAGTFDIYSGSHTYFGSDMNIDALNMLGGIATLHTNSTPTNRTLTVNTYNPVFSPTLDYVIINPITTIDNDHCDNSQAPAGLVSYWGFEGDANDNFGTNNGIISGAIITTGKIGNGMYFNGNDYIIIPNDPSIKFTGSMTLSAWIKGKSSLANACSILGIAGAGGSRYCMGPNNIGDVYFFIGQYGIPLKFTSVTNVSNPLVWEHHVGVYSAEDQEINLYKDGVLIGTTTGVPTSAYVDNGADLLIGNRGSLDISSFFTGIIDEVAIFNKALTSCEVAELYGRTAGYCVGEFPVCNIKSYISGYKEESDRLDVSLKQYRFTNLRKTLPLTLNEAYNTIFNIKNNLGRATSGDRLMTPFGFRAPVPDLIASGENTTVELKVKFFNLNGE